MTSEVLLAVNTQSRREQRAESPEAPTTLKQFRHSVSVVYLYRHSLILSFSDTTFRLSMARQHEASHH